MLKETRNLASESSPPVIVGLMWFAVIVAFTSAVGYGIYWFTAPAKVAIDNRVFHESQPYNDGMARDLENMQMAYMAADDAGKAALRATIQHRFAGYDAARLPQNLQAFLAEIR